MIFVTSPTTVAHFVRPIAGAFLACGWSVDIVSAPGDELDGTAREIGAASHAIPLHRGFAPVAMLRALVNATRLVRRLGPDLVISATPAAGLVGVLSGRIAGTNAKILHLAWGRRSEALRFPLKQLLEGLEAATVAFADATLANSESLSVAIKRSIRRRASVTVLGEGSSHGVDLSRFRYEPPKPRVRPVIGFVGRVRRDKGVIELLEALELLTQRGCAFEARIFGKIEEPDLAPRIAVTPRTSYMSFASDMPEVMMDLDVLCLPSWREGFPNVVLEAGAAGRPVVTTTATGAIDSVVDGVTGLLVPPRDSYALADALERLLLSPELRTTMGESGRKRVEAAFEQSVVCLRLVDFAVDLCGLERTR
ncbi:glycosyltransferase [Nocardioides sp.]|uniref:glycosyltransferase n=1 Tax=Nocardioides sp. TaxID=35761 RepID=UPI0026063CE2|nr:glycosyltransferase [Nocardioides sp.]MCW2738298.1 glycosyltransferase family 1 protein [Nocardioides sp.]